MITVDNLSKIFSLSRSQRKEWGGNIRQLEAVKNISFTCKPGRVFSLIGPNGAGKTTTLRIIATILKPTVGRVEVDGLDVVKYPLEVKKKIGFLTGTTGLYDRLTPDELVEYFARLNDIDRKTFLRRKDELFTLLGIHEFARQRIGKLSTGMRQKVSIARTMIHDPEVVVFDEPTAGLDVITANHIIELVRSCRNQGKTVLFSTHIMAEVELLSDDIAIIHKGSIIRHSTFEEFKKSLGGKSMVEGFIQLINESAA